MRLGATGRGFDLGDCNGTASRTGKGETSTARRRDVWLITFGETPDTLQTVVGVDQRASLDQLDRALQTGDGFGRRARRRLRRTLCVRTRQ